MTEGDQLHRRYLTDAQYATHENLAARQSIYDFQHPRIELPRETLDHAALEGNETVVDVGCGNGDYLAELARRGHTLNVLGVDLSVGMLDAAHRRSSSAVLVAADVAALPLRSQLADVTLAAHMLYHASNPQQAAGELRRVTRDGGLLLVVLNGADHLQELRDLVREVAVDVGEPPPKSFSRVDLAQGEVLLGEVFDEVTRYDLRAVLEVPSPEPIERYVASTAVAKRAADPGGLLEAVRAHVRSHLERHLEFTIATHVGCLVCR